MKNLNDIYKYQVAISRVHMVDGSVREGWFLNGKLHGPVRGACKVSLTLIVLG
mgnify:FL=1